MDKTNITPRRVIGGVDTHKDLHVAAVVDDRDSILETRSFASTRQGYRQMLAWMRGFGELERIGIESTGSYGAGLLRFLQAAGVQVLEITATDRQDRRRRGKNDDLDAQNAAHATFAGIRAVTRRSRDGWWNPSGFSRFAARPPSLRNGCSPAQAKARTAEGAGAT
ncbi:hypothetical protein GCM10011402_37390 [Paracoccus acridae]|uniref:Transposase IS110-like N-terminal domain-containing protein n=1 Tax=Paracoccus acridae TaxID=1795310 RepID=A0ABQ1VNH1_9RHOB|nr:hypothetical protein GCM10011402_37390 [Paracoccus acridae]